LRKKEKKCKGGKRGGAISVYFATGNERKRRKKKSLKKKRKYKKTAPTPFFLLGLGDVRKEKSKGAKERTPSITCGVCL